MRKWELVGGPLCGEDVYLPPWQSEHRIAKCKVDLSAALSTAAPVPNTPHQMLTGVYRSEGERDYKRRLLRWQGWA